MMLGGYPFPWSPDKWTMPDARQVVTGLPTYSSDVVFFYGQKIIGKQIDLEWEFMTQVQFDALDVLYQVGLPMEWDMEEALDPRIFLVEVSSLDATLFDVALWDQPYRKDVKMSLIILTDPEAGIS